MEQAVFDRKAKELDVQFQKADAKLNRLKTEKQDRLIRVCGVKKYVENLRGLAKRSEAEQGEAERSEAEQGEAERSKAGPIDVWNEQAWCLLVTQVTVHADGRAVFLFRAENCIAVAVDPL